MFDQDRQLFPDDFSDIEYAMEEDPEDYKSNADSENFMGVLDQICGRARNEHNTEPNEMALRAYQAAALTRIADGIEKHNKLLEMLLEKMG